VWCISCVAQHAAKCRWTRTFFQDSPKWPNLGLNGLQAQQCRW
jgi:hypothetical protein